MQQVVHRRKFRIIVTISCLFTILIVIFGLIFGEYIYRHTSVMLKEASSKSFGQINAELSREYRGTRQNISQTIHILGSTSISTAKTVAERLSALPLFSAALEHEPRLSALQVGYGNGDYFIVRPLLSKYMRSRFSAPPDSTLVVDNITRDTDDLRKIQRFWFSKDLKEIKRTEAKMAEYDPRLRPWYQLAMSATRTVETDPYLFFFIKQMGVTIAYRQPATDSVLAGDMTLFHLSELLSQYQPTPNSELIILEKKGDEYLVAAYGDPDKMLIKQGEALTRAHPTNLGSMVIDHAVSLPAVLDDFFSFSFEGQDWFGSTRKLQIPDRDNLYLVLLSPKRELLAGARKLQTHAIYFTLAMTLLAVPITWFLARKISIPIQSLARVTAGISQFNFTAEPAAPSFIKEVDELGQAVNMMESTIGRFISLINSLASEQDFDELLRKITEETMTISGADAACTYIVDEARQALRPGAVKTSAGAFEDDLLPVFDLSEKSELVSILNTKERVVKKIETISFLGKLLGTQTQDVAELVALPLQNREGQGIGVLCLLFRDTFSSTDKEQSGLLAFIDAFSGFAAVTLESRRMLRMQKDLLESFMKLLAGAIDSKSPYTGRHCQRVPVLTKLLIRKACEAEHGPFAGYSLSKKQWEAIHIASWLHDCGKITTPEYVVDKSTKLETIYNRIHEIRTRFEILKRDAEIRCLQAIADGGDPAPLKRGLAEEWRKLDENYAFVAECNIGGESMSSERLERLKRIAGKTWHRTLDDRLGLSWEELQRKQRTPRQHLPVVEKLIDDRVDHLIERKQQDLLDEENEYGFILDVPKYLYNRGELYNLSVERGTLTREERYKINDHIVQTIIMLKRLPYPKHLAEVPDLAGGHHEKMDGTGYPRRLAAEQMSLPARSMVIADIFEALSASDRPYKKPKKISEVLKIMGRMKEEGHIDPDLFDLFLTSGACREYAEEFLASEQIDEVDISRYTG